MQNAESKVIHEVSTALNMLVDSLDLPALQVVFAELFDRVNEGVLAARLDADDVLLERFVELRTADGATFSAPVEWLSNSERLIVDLQSKAQGRSELVMVAASVRAVADDSP